MKFLPLACALAMLVCQGAGARQPGGHDHHAMTTDVAGSVMGENRSRLPRGCESISEDVHMTIHAGREHAAGRPGLIFGMSDHEVRVPPCARLAVTFVNDDEVRHQWMVHGLPRYLYPGGMFHIEVAGGHRKTGTFILPPEDRTYLIHCDIAQHMEKGMRGQLVVGAGDGDLWGVPGISDDFLRADYLPRAAWLALGGAVLAGALLGWRLGRSEPREAGGPAGKA